MRLGSGGTSAGEWKRTVDFQPTVQPMLRRRFRVRFRLVLRSVQRFLLHHVLHADDPPDRLALGAAIGVFITFTPTVGFQTPLVIFCAWLLRANKVIGLPILWISNPATMVPIYYGCYAVGRFVLQVDAIGRRWWNELYRPPDNWWDAVVFYWSRLLHIAGPLWLGSVIVGLLLAYPTYYAVYHAIVRYRLLRWGQLVPPLAATFSRDAGPPPPEHPPAA
jgi:uncharacterized protein